MTSGAGLDPRALPAAHSPQPSNDRRSRLPGRRAADLLSLTAGGRLGDGQFLHRTALVITLVIATALIVALIWFANSVFLLLFGGILLAVLLRAPTNWLIRHTRLPENVALMVSMGAAGLLLMALIYLFSVTLGQQIGQLVETLPRAAASLRHWVYQYSWAKPLRTVVWELGRVLLDVKTRGQAKGLISGAFDGLVGVVV